LLKDTCYFEPDQLMETQVMEAAIPQLLDELGRDALNLGRKDLSA
jgi:hypothetical protein